MTGPGIRFAWVLVICAAAGTFRSAAVAQEWRGKATLGVEVNGAKGRPISGAVVTIRLEDAGRNDGPEPRRTDDRGEVNFIGITAGTWSLEVVHPEHLSYVSSVIIGGRKKPVVLTEFLQASGTGRRTMRVRFLKGVTEARGIETPSERVAASRVPTATTPTPAPTAPVVKPAPRAAVPASEPADETTPIVSSAAETRPEDPEDEGRAPAAGESGSPTSAEARDDDDAVVPRAPSSEARGEIAAAAAPPQPESALRPSDEVAAPEPRPTAAEEPRLPAGVDPVPETPRGPSEPQPTIAPRATAATSPSAVAAPTGEPAPAGAAAEEATEPPAQPAPVSPAEVPAASIPLPRSLEPPGPPDTATEKKPSGVPATPTEASAPPAPDRASLRSFRDRTCVECKPGEWGVSAAVAAAPGSGSGCPEGTAARAHRAVTELLGRRARSLVDFGGPLPPPRPALEAGDSCVLVAVVLPAGARFTGFRFEAADGADRRDCLPDEPCEIGDARWLINPAIARAEGVSVVYSLFENQSVDRARTAALTAYFLPPPEWPATP